ncbi:MAG: O-antigen ligase family protein [Caldilineaceae bacterium]|jgi:O-antigen ligase|nr:O-antigen ligase family protein [Caldilineaceae bacterium]
MQFPSTARNLRQRFTVERYTFLTFIVVSGVLIFIPLITFFYINGQLDPLLVVTALLGVTVAFRLFKVEERSNKGIVLLVITAGMLSFVSLPTGRESKVPISMVISLLLVGMWLFSMLFGRTKIRPSPVNRPLIAFVLISIISYVWSQIFRDPLLLVWSSFPVVQVAALTVNIFLPLTLLYVANHLTEVKWLKYLTAVVIFFGIVSVILFFFNSSLGNFFFYRGTRGLFSMWVVALVYALALFHKELKPWQQAILLALVAVFVYRYFIVGRSWVSGWLPMGVAAMVITWIRSRRLFLILTLVGLLYFSFNFNFYYQNIVVAEEDEGSGSGRIGLWEQNLILVANHFLFGVGPAGYAPYYMTYHPEEARSTHNNYFDLLAQTGIIGFVTFWSLLLSLIKIGQKTLRRYAGQRNFEEVFAVATLSGIVGMLVAMMLGDWVLPFAYNETISGFDNAVLTWVLLGGMVALGAFRQHSNEDENDAHFAPPTEEGLL